MVVCDVLVIYSNSVVKSDLRGCLEAIFGPKVLRNEVRCATYFPHLQMQKKEEELMHPAMW